HALEMVALDDVPRLAGCLAGPDADRHVERLEVQLLAVDDAVHADGATQGGKVTLPDFLRRRVVVLEVIVQEHQPTCERAADNLRLCLQDRAGSTLRRPYV